MEEIEILCKLFHLITLLHLSHIVNNLEIQTIRIGSVYYRAFVFKNVQKINFQATTEKK